MAETEDILIDQQQGRALWDLSQKNLDLYSIPTKPESSFHIRNFEELYQEQDNYDLSLQQGFTKTEDFEKKARQNSSWIGQYKRANFYDGSFCHYYDTDSDQIDKSKNPILIFTGVGGFIIPWVQVYENQKDTRLIQFIYPGYDGHDERRGSYMGDLLQMADMVHSLMDQLLLSKAIIYGFSCGGFLQTAFVYLYPNRVAGIGKIATIGYPYWNRHLTRNMKTEKAWYAYSYKDLSDESKREEIVNSIQYDYFKYQQSSKFFCIFKLYRSYDEYVYPMLRKSNWIHPANIPYMIIHEWRDPSVTIEGNGLSHYELLIKRQCQIKLSIQQNQLLQSIVNQYGLKNFNYEHFNQNFFIVVEGDSHPVHYRKGKIIKNPMRFFDEFCKIVNPVQINPKL